MKLVVPNLVEDRKSQLNSVQLARGFAALAVVAFHAETIQEKYFQVKVLPQFFDGGISGVDLFFVISGFVMVLTTRGRHGKPKEVGKFLWNRFFRIYPTYWAYFFALVPVALLFPSFINASQGGRVDFVSSFFLLPTDILPILLVAWTLTLELWFYVVFAIILFLPERWIIAALSVWFVALVAINWAGPISANPYLELPTNAMAIEFVFGGAVALLFRHLNRVVAAIAGVAGIVVVIALGNPVPADLYAGPGLERPFTLGVGYALILLSITAVEHRSGGVGVFKRFTIFGDMSYSVYLCHILVLSALGRVWASISGSFGTNLFAVIVWWVFTIALVLAVGYLSYRLIERPVMALSKRWRVKVFKPTPKPEPVDAAAPTTRETQQ